MRQEIIDLYDAYTHETLDRRAFMERLTVLSGGSRRRDRTAAAAGSEQRQGSDHLADRPAR